MRLFKSSNLYNWRSIIHLMCYCSHLIWFPINSCYVFFVSLKNFAFSDIASFICTIGWQNWTNAWVEPLLYPCKLKLFLKDLHSCFIFFQKPVKFFILDPIIKFVIYCWSTGCGVAVEFSLWIWRCFKICRCAFLKFTNTYNFPFSYWVTWRMCFMRNSNSRTSALFFML